MLLPKREDAIHKNWLYRILAAIADDPFLQTVLRFKGGTCAAMRNIIERFSVDLDFDLLDKKAIPETSHHLEKIFADLGLTIKDHSKKVPQYFLQYPNTPGHRNTLRIDITTPPPRANEYEPVRFMDIDRIIYCQTIPTMFANKLVALMERHEKYGSIAGRDIFDIHTFFIKGFHYKAEIIIARRKVSPRKFFQQLKKFIEKNITLTILDEDLNTLIPPTGFHQIRKLLKQEVLALINDEIERL